MRTIAIITQEEEQDFIFNLNNILSKMDMEYCLIKEEQILGDKYFDYVVLHSKPKKVSISLNSSYSFINMDELQGDNVDVYGNVITFGFGRKNTVTISSASKENQEFLYCIQRYLNINALGMLGPEEILIDVEFSSEKELYAYMVGITIALIEGKDSKYIGEKLRGKIMV
jgi:hypothetical protein